MIIPAAGTGAAPAADEIITWCRDQLAHFKCPKTVEFVDSLPRTTTGKVLKRELRARMPVPSSMPPSPTAEPPAGEVPS